MDVKCYKGHVNCRLMTEHIIFVSELTVEDWRRVVRVLGHDEIIHIIEEDTVIKNWDSRETAFQAYNRWCKLDYEKASICKLSEALETVGRRDVVRNLRKNFKVFGKYYH